MKYVSSAFVAAIMLASTGCPSFVKAPGPGYAATPIPTGKAVIHFYRPAQKIMSDYPFFMSLPEAANNCFRVESGGFTTFETEPGDVTVGGIMLTYRKMTFHLKAGDERFVEIKVVDDDGVMEEVAANDAKPKLAETRGINTCSPEQVKRQ